MRQAMFSKGQNRGTFLFELVLIGGIKAVAVLYDKHSCKSALLYKGLGMTGAFCNPRGIGW